MLSNDELKTKLSLVHPEYFDIDKKGGKKWKTARIFSTVLYPENIDNIDKCCESVGVPCSLSPLHDSDLKDNSTGELKKAHYHLVVYFKGKTTPYNFYTILCGAFGDNAFSTIEIGRDLGALIRYQIHLDSPDKAQYKADDIKDFNGFCSIDYLSSGDVMGNVNKLMDLIDNENIITYAELTRFLRENDPVLQSSLIKDSKLSHFVNSYLRGKEHELWYQGNVEKGYTKVKLSDNTEKVIFNRQIHI